MSWNTFTAHTKNGTFLACEEINWSRLDGKWDLLDVIKAVVYRCGGR